MKKGAFPQKFVLTADAASLTPANPQSQDMIGELVYYIQSDSRAPNN